MKKQHRVGAAVAALALLAASCSGTTTVTTEALTSGARTPSSTVAPTTTESRQDAVTTTAAPTTTGFVPLAEIPLEVPPFEEVAITTEDGIELYASYWPGNEVAVIFGHDFDNSTQGSTPRPPQSSESILPFAATIAQEGWTVIAPDFRSHGRSAGELNIRNSPIDLKAVYNWLRNEGYETIVMIGWVGSGTTAVVLDAADDEVNFAGIAMVFSPLQDTGLDAQKVIGNLDIPMYFIGSNAGTTARSAKFLAAEALDSRGLTLFERVPSGLQFIDVYGPEMMGRLLQFLDEITA